MTNNRYERVTPDQIYHRIKSNDCFDYRVYFDGSYFYMAPSCNYNDRVYEDDPNLELIGTYNDKTKFMDLVGDCEEAKKLRKTA